MISENKNSFFSLRFPIESHTDVQTENLKDSIDLVLGAINVSDEIYEFKNTESIIYFFKTNNRKRKGQLNRYCDKFLPKEQIYDSKNLERVVFNSEINRMIKNPNFKIENKPKSISNNYTGRDIKVFDNEEKWRPWQKTLYNLLFYPDGSQRIPPDRTIYTIVDEVGNTGKSTFFKYLITKNDDNMGRLSYGTSSQLKASITKIGTKWCYLVDLSRTKGKNDSESDLMALIEDLKTGTISSFMYGAGTNLLFDPPFVIISTNKDFDYSSLSSDRWKLFSINKKYELVDRPFPNKNLTLIKKKPKK